MEFFMTLLYLLASIILATILNKKWSNIPLPIFQIGIGVILWIIPLQTTLFFEPEMFMICIIAPLLFSEGQHISRKELLDLHRPILLLAFGLVFATVFIGGLLIHLLIPEMPRAVAFALAAIISPTDTVAVGALTKGLKLPKNLMPILEGESLLNDAAGIVAFKVALAAALTGMFSAGDSFLNFWVVALGGLVIGFVMGFVIVSFRLFLRKHELEEISMLIVIQILTPFIIFEVAESFGVSGVLAVVAAGVVHGIERDRLQKTTTKLQIISSNTWYVIQYVLNGLVFVLLGFMLPSVYYGIKASNEKSIGILLLLTILISLGLFFVRFLWVFLWYKTFVKKREKIANKFFVNHFQIEKTQEEVGVTYSRVKYALSAAVCGVHGTITLATALSIPYMMTDGIDFPMRDTVIFIAAGVILISLFAAIIVLPLLIEKPMQLLDEMMSTNEAYKHILKNTISQMNSEFVREEKPAFQQVIRDLNEQLLDLNTITLKRPSKEVMQSLIDKGAEKERIVVKELINEHKISASILEMYELYLERKKQLLVKTPFKTLKLMLKTLNFKRKLRKNKEARVNFSKTINENKELINEFRFAQMTASRTAAQFIHEQINNDNHHEAMFILQSYERFANQMNTMMDGGTEFEEEVKHYHLSAIQIGRDMIQQLLETNKINVNTARELRENLLYDEMLMIGE